ncbi:hypothetical protein B0T25DRAFT_181435 [Lasiosphaeria hispida]|uniref:Uncharacterized protein n=1 Tax=Lasiosphaeria hispida TaxID=260671 RepID=A0AAJ0HH29_9PEZI|nr:hypothetical protein B0T25DRAFT_181435 [Lasiosphaeria hispida]
MLIGGRTLPRGSSACNKVPRLRDVTMDSSLARRSFARHTRQASAQVPLLLFYHPRHGSCYIGKCLLMGSRGLETSNSQNVRDRSLGKRCSRASRSTISARRKRRRHCAPDLIGPRSIHLSGSRQPAYAAGKGTNCRESGAGPLSWHKHVEITPPLPEPDLPTAGLECGGAANCLPSGFLRGPPNAEAQQWHDWVDGPLGPLRLATGLRASQRQNEAKPGLKKCAEGVRHRTDTKCGIRWGRASTGPAAVATVSGVGMELVVGLSARLAAIHFACKSFGSPANPTPSRPPPFSFQPLDPFCPKSLR